MSEIKFMAIMFMAIVTSCSVPPADSQQFVKQDERDFLDRYIFTLDMSDIKCCYNLDLYTRIDCTDKQFRQGGDFKIETFWISPSGKFYTESFILPLSSVTRRSAFTKDYLVPYRSGLVPIEHGQWKLFIRASSDAVITGMRGMGVKFRAIPIVTLKK